MTISVLALAEDEGITRVKVDIWVQLAVLEILISSSSLLQGNGNINQRIPALDFKDLLRNFSDDSSSGVKVLVHPAG